MVFHVFTFIHYLYVKKARGDSKQNITQRNYARILYTEAKDVMSLDGSLTERLPDD